MKEKIDWFCKIIRIAGVNFPFAASLVQLQSEIDSIEFNERIRKLEDPINNLHKDICSVSEVLYSALSRSKKQTLYLSDQFYVEYSRPLAILEKQGYIVKIKEIGSFYPIGLRVSDPSFIMYMCNLFEDKIKMQKAFEIVDSCKIGQWLNGDELKSEIGLPRSVICAIFEIYVAKGYGILSSIINSCNYMCNS